MGKALIIAEKPSVASDIAKADAQAEVAGVREWYGKFGDHLPKPLAGELDGLAKRVEAQPEVWSAK